ncbi:MAG: DUF1611 domain-containing protein [Candidatus Eremiobacteraeota bacterium]|nr:DUF1611 domain-containing protein [Candidatus Eremiobacteraeota bacterium]
MESANLHPSPKRRRYLILSPGEFATNAKTAHGVIRYGHDQTVAVIDADNAGKTVHDVLSYLKSDTPIVADVESGLKYDPTSLLIGVAPVGGALPPSWRGEILKAIDAKLEIVSGLHELIADDSEFSAAAKRSGSRIWDVRVPPQVPLFSGAAYNVRQPILLTVGSDCAVGKLTVSLEIARAAREHGVRARVAPTGQTGIMIEGWGICIDRVISDFAPGAAEALVLEAAKDSELIVVEGQGGINHPAYAPVTLALLYGTAPDALLLVGDPTRATLEGGFATPRLSWGKLIEVYEELASTVKPAKVVGIALNTFQLTDREARSEIERARAETSLPVDDVVRNGPEALYEAIAPQLSKRSQLVA